VVPFSPSTSFVSFSQIGWGFGPFTKEAGLLNIGTLPPAFSALAVRAAMSIAPSSRTWQPGPPVLWVQLGMLTALRPHGLVMSYAKLKQSKKTPSILSEAASGAMTLSM